MAPKADSPDDIPPGMLPPNSFVYVWIAHTRRCGHPPLTRVAFLRLGAGGGGGQHAASEWVPPTRACPFHSWRPLTGLPLAQSSPQFDSYIQSRARGVPPAEARSRQKGGRRRPPTPQQQQQAEAEQQQQEGEGVFVPQEVFEKMKAEAAFLDQERRNLEREYKEWLHERQQFEETMAAAEGAQQQQQQHWSETATPAVDLAALARQSYQEGMEEGFSAGEKITLEKHRADLLQREEGASSRVRTLIDSTLARHKLTPTGVGCQKQRLALLQCLKVRPAAGDAPVPCAALAQAFNSCAAQLREQSLGKWK